MTLKTLRKQTFHTILVSLVLGFSGILSSCDESFPQIELINISGTALESTTSAPVAGATITIVGQEDIDSQLTGVDGKFSFTGLRLDDATYELSVNHPEYIAETLFLTIENGKQNGELNATLIASEALTLDQSAVDFGSGLTEIILNVTSISSSSITISVSSEASWITIDEPNFALAANGQKAIQLSIDRESVDIGVYESTLLLAVAGRPSQQVVIKMQKLDPASAILALDATSMDFGKAIASQSLIISNTGKSNLNWSAAAKDEWLSLSIVTGVIEPSLNQTIEISIDRSALASGSYESTVDFAGDGGTATLTVLMEVDNSVGLLKLSTTSLDLGTKETELISLTNDGTAELNWTATIQEDWISLSANSGALAVGATESYTITIDNSNLGTGIHEGSIVFGAGGENTTLSIAILVEGGELTISRTEVQFGSDESVVQLTFSNTGVRSLTWVATEDATWLNMAPKNGTIVAGGEALVVVEANRASLAIGDYSTQITIDVDGTATMLTASMSVAQDTDMDGVPDEIDADMDGDGLMEIYTINDLDAIRNDLDGTGEGKSGAPAGGFTGYELMNDLDFSSDASYSDLALKPSVTSGSGWLPIGLGKNIYFQAIFEGNDFKIENLLINRTTDYTGLFAFTNLSAVIRNIHIDIKFLIGGDFSAGLIGNNDGGVVLNCSVSGKVTGGTDVGLLIGEDNGGTVTSCYSTGEVVGTVAVGGLIGDLDNSNPSFIYNSFSTAIVTGTDYVGGLIGTTSNDTEIKNSYATGNVNASGQYSGGLLGYFHSGANLESCYATGNIQSSSGYVGGLVGYNFSGTIISCYSTGIATGSSSVGGLVGSNRSSIASSNYWDTQTSGLSSSSGGTGKTTGELQSQTSNDGIYITWSSDAWDFGNSSQYPALKDMPGGLDAQRD